MASHARLKSATMPACWAVGVVRACEVRMRRRDAPCFTDAERVALELVEAVLTPNPFGERVPDELYAKASAHYDDKALWTLTLAIAQMCFFIPVALIAKPIPGREPHYSKSGIFT